MLLGLRVVQGLCMPGLITVGVPYVAEAYAPQLGSRAMGYYVTALVAGGLIGRVGVALHDGGDVVAASRSGCSRCCRSPRRC